MHHVDHFDLPDQDQPGDREEAVIRDDLAAALATYIGRYPLRCVSLRDRVRTLTMHSEAELDRLIPEVDYLLGIAEWQHRKGQAA